LTGVMNMSKSMAAKRKITLTNRTVGQDIPPIHADGTRFKQVMLNLISNAIKYNKPGGHVTVECTQTINGFVRVIVSDDGLGIDEKLQDKLFLPFERLGYEASKVEGSGIGLSITKELVELMDGEVGFESEVGVGSKFWVDFPVQDHSRNSVDDGPALTFVPETPAPETGHSSPVENVGHDDGAKRVLYVEDNMSNIRLMKGIVKNIKNCSLTAVLSAEEGFEKLKSDTFDLILMDINLPGIDGVEAMRLLAADSKMKHVPVLAVSAAAMPSDIERAMLAGFRGYLTKPLHVKETVQALQSALEAA